MFRGQIIPNESQVRGGQGMDAFESGRSKYLKMTLGLDSRGRVCH
jgi:hypothetical protein